MIEWTQVSETAFEAEAQRRGYKLVDLDDFQYDAHQEHNAGMHDDHVTDCPDCEAEDAS